MFNNNEIGEEMDNSGFDSAQEQGEQAVFADKVLKCEDCHEDFVFTAGEQEFFASKGFKNTPKRCKSCRDYRKRNSAGATKLYPIKCAACEKDDQVPFQPREGRDVYCSECFEKIRNNQGNSKVNG